MDKKNLASYIDHTLLKPETAIVDIKKLCDEAIEHGFASVCVNPCYVTSVKEFLKESDVKICTVVGFPLGATTSEVKAFEAAQAIENGANEIDMVINIGALKEERYDYVESDIKSVAEKCKGKALLKVIIETCVLDDEQKTRACELAKSAGADYVKTSTGFSTSGAKVSDILLMRNTVGRDMGVKASGGIRDLETALKMIEAGASRIGASASVKIINEMDK